MSVRPETGEIVAFLNSLVEVDRYAVAELLSVAARCNNAMADHSSVQVRDRGLAYLEPGTYRVGILGLLNGYCGTLEDGGGPIAAVYEEGRLVRFLNRAAPDASR